MIDSQAISGPRSSRRPRRGGRGGIVIAPIVDVPLDLGTVVLLIPTVVVLSLVLSGLGILIGSFARSQQGFQLFMQMLVFPMVFLAGVFFPVDSVPLWMEVASKVNPVTYGVDAIPAGLPGFGPGRGRPRRDGLRPHHELRRRGGHRRLLGVMLMAGAIWAFGRQE